MLLLSNVVLIGIGLNKEIWWQLLVVIVSSILSGFAYPLVDAVYTDIVARMGRERKHLIGLSGSTFSLAYIVGPIVAGFIAQLVGEQQTFVVVGFGAALVNFVLLFITPKKLKIPTAEIHAWKD
jgi:MFS family permease